MIDLPTNIDLDNSEFAKAYKVLQNTDANVFITGKLNFLSTAKLRPKEAEPLRIVIEVYDTFGMQHLANEYRNYLTNL